MLHLVSCSTQFVFAFCFFGKISYFYQSAITPCVNQLTTFPSFALWMRVFFPFLVTNLLHRLKHWFVFFVCPQFDRSCVPVPKKNDRLFTCHDAPPRQKVLGDVGFNQHKVTAEFFKLITIHGCLLLVMLGRDKKCIHGKWFYHRTWTCDLMVSNHWFVRTIYHLLGYVPGCTHALSKNLPSHTHSCSKLSPENDQTRRTTKQWL